MGEWKRICQRLQFSPREADIVDGLLARMDVPDIAAVLKIAVGSVRARLQDVYRKLGVHSRDQLVVHVLEAHLERCSASDGTPNVAAHVKPRKSGRASTTAPE